MKKVLILFSFFFSLWTIGNAQPKWILLENAPIFNLGTKEKFIDLSIVEDTISALTSNLAFYKSIDNGLSWNFFGYNTNIYPDTLYNRIIFKDRSKGIMYRKVSSSNYSYTINGGISWNTTNLDSSNHILFSQSEKDIHTLATRNFTSNFYNLFKANDSLKFEYLDSIRINFSLFHYPRDFQVVDSFLVIFSDKGIFYHKIGYPNHMDTLSTDFIGIPTSKYYLNGKFYIAGYGSTFSILKIYDKNLKLLNSNSFIFNQGFNGTYNDNSLCVNENEEICFGSNSIYAFVSRSTNQNVFGEYVSPNIERVVSSDYNFFAFGKGIYKRIGFTTSLFDMNENLNRLFEIFPNPSNGQLVNIVFDEVNVNSNLTVTDLLGKKIYSDFVIDKNIKRIEVLLPKGIFLINYRSSKFSQSQKLVIY